MRLLGFLLLALAVLVLLIRGNRHEHRRRAEWRRDCVPHDGGNHTNS